MPTKNQKKAIARIFADLIKADRIVDTGEMNFWEKICNRYAIDRQIHIEAKSLPFADAVNIICSSDEESLIKGFLDDCKAMTVSDGFCAHSEALIMSALNLMLDVNREQSVEVYSIPRANFNIDVATVVYVESDFDQHTNKAIRANYRAIFKELQLAGFHFVYLPQVIDHYHHTDENLFKRMLSFLAPDMSDESVDHTYENLMKMTTASFCNDILCNRGGMDQLRNTYPSLLIKIGNSFVGDVEYANYLKIEVADDILHTVQQYADDFCSMLSSDIFVVNTSEERDNQFHFFGFYKQLLDIFLIRKNIRSTILIDPYRDEILFPEIDAELSNVGLSERALYILLLCQGNEGLNFKQPGRNDSKIEHERYKKRMEKIQKRYSEIYKNFLGAERDPADISQRTTRSPLIARLRASVKLLKGLYNPKDYTIAEADKHLFIHIDPSMVFVGTKKESIPLLESDIYRRIKGL